MSGRTPTRSIVALSIGGCGSAAALRICDPLLPYLAREYDVGLAAAAQTVTAFAIAYGLLQLAYGPIGDRYGKYRVVTIATIGCALTTLACAVAPTLPALVAARAFAGATAGALIPLSLAWIGDVVAYERRQSVLARYLIGQMFGIALGQVLGGIGADRFGAGPVFLALAAWFAVAAVLMGRYAPASEEAVHHGGRGVVRRFLAVLDVRWSRVVLLTVFVEGLLLVGALAFVPTHLHRVYDLPLTAAGAIVMLYAAGGFVYAVLSPVLVRRLGEPGLAARGRRAVDALLRGPRDADDSGGRGDRLSRRRPRLLHAAQHAAGERDADGAGAAREQPRAVRVHPLPWSIVRRDARGDADRARRNRSGDRRGRRPVARRGARVRARAAATSRMIRSDEFSPGRRPSSGTAGFSLDRILRPRMR